MSPRAIDRLDAMHWRLIDETDMYWMDELIPTPTREVLQSEPNEAVKRYLKNEEERCLEKLASTTGASGRRHPPCPCISPDLRTSAVFACITFIE